MQGMLKISKICVRQKYEHFYRWRQNFEWFARGITFIVRIDSFIHNHATMVRDYEFLSVTGYGAIFPFLITQ